jgi:hypothetical protein
VVLQPCKQRWIARAATADHHLGQPRGGGGGGATTVRRHPTGPELCVGIRCIGISRRDRTGRVCQ